MKQKTNNDLIQDLMDYSPYGALCQAFIMQAIEERCDDVIAQQEALKQAQLDEESNGRISLVNISSWIGIAHNIKKRIRAFYENNHDLDTFKFYEPEKP